MWGYLASCAIGKRKLVKEMLKRFIRKYKYKVKILRGFKLWLKKKFVYSKKIKKKKFRKMYNKLYIKNLHTVLKFRLYYGDMTIKRFRRYLQRLNKRRLNFTSKLFFLLESRLDILLCRLNFVKNPRDARKLLKSNKVVVNGVIISNINYHVYIHDIIDIKYDLCLKLFMKIIDNLSKKKFIFNYPRYVEMNYKLMRCMFVSYPKKQDIPSIWRQNFGFIRSFI